MWPRGMKGVMLGVERDLPPMLRAVSESGLASDGYAVMCFCSSVSFDGFELERT
jgi:hypothetical protein